MRTSPVHYIAPSAISIVPNCNGSSNDLAVTISQGVKIKVYSPRAGIDKVKETGEYQEWILTGRNRRLADSTKPYTIYARLPKSDKNGGYLIFSPMTPQEGGEYMDNWTQKYSWVTTDGLYIFGGDSSEDEQRFNPNYFMVRLGDVSLPDANNQRTVTLDTGILGTDQFNDEWALRPDELPLRIELGCTIGDEDAGPTPYVYWGQSLVLTAMLTEGWTGTDIQRFDRWEIVRNSGDAAADNAWNYQEVEGQETLSPHLMPDGQITLQHIFGGTDDFNGAFSVAFTILAVGHNADTLPREILKTATINIMAETITTYELEQSSAAVTYNPLDNTYSPANVVTFRIRTKAQDGSVSFADDSHIALAQLRLYALPEGEAAESRTLLTFTGGTASLPVTAFAGKSINLWLENGAQVVLARTTVAYIRYGEKGDTPISIYRWYKVGLTPLKPTSTSSEEPAPAAGDVTGEANVYPTDKWSKAAPDRPATGEWALWMCGSIKHGSGTIDTWSTPVRISGDKGTAGEDASDHEYIYIRQNTYPFSGKLPANITTPAASSTGKTVADDDFVPVGWSDKALPPDNDNRYVYMSVREKPAGEDQQWGPFGNPVLWSNWGVRGTDGDGVEHVFIRTQNNVPPVMESEQTEYASDEFRPTITADSQTDSLTEQAQTTDDPMGPNSTYPYEWVATRSKGPAAPDGTRQWTRYTGKDNDYKMSLWSRWAEDGVPPEQIYIHTSSYPYNGSTPASVDADGNVPSGGWSATPVGVSQQYPYEYRSVRRKINGHWGAWSPPQLDAKWSSDGTSISIKGGADLVIGWDENLPRTDDDGFRCLMNNNDGDDMEVYEIDDWQQLTGSWQGYSANIGDIYLVDGDMWMKQNNAATASSPRWKNLGRIQGPAGIDGKNAVRIDIDNQADIIACREDGTVRFTRIVTVHANIHDGDSPAMTGVSTTQTVADMAIAGVTPSVFTLVDGMLTVTWQFVAGTVLAPGSYAKEITLNYNGKSYTAQFSLTSSNTSAVYQLHPNMSEVSFQVDANGSYTPPTQNVYCGYTKTDGGGTLTFPGNNIANLWREGGAPYNIFFRRQFSGGMFSSWLWAKDLQGGILPIDRSTTDIGIEFAMSSASSISLLSDQNIIDRELIPIVKGGKNGKDGTSPWIADLDNEMDSVACNLNGHPERVQTVETKVSMFYGNTPKACSIEVFDGVEGGDPYENGVQHDEVVAGVKVTWNDSTGVITAQFDTSASFSSGNIIFCIKLTPVEDSTQYRYLYFTVNGIRPGANGEPATTYQLVPSVSEIIRQKDGTYSPTLLTCYCTSLKEGTATDNPSSATMQYSYDDYKWMAFDNSTVFEASTIYAQNAKKLYLRLLVDGKVMDKETIPVVEDGKDGTSPWIADLDNEMDSVACNLEGHPERVQTVETKVSMFYGNLQKACSIEVFDGVEGGDPYENGVQHDEVVAGVKVTWNDSTGVITAQFDTAADFSSGNIIFCIKLTPTEDSTQYRYLYFTVNGIRPGANGEPATTYQLVPSVSEIIRRKDGSYSPASLTCYCTSLKDGTATDNPSGATMQYSYDGSNWTAFDNSTVFAASTIYAQNAKKLYLRLLVDGIVMDNETIPVLEDGDDAQDVNPNILLRTIFDRGMPFVLEAWTRNSELISVDGATDTIVNGRKSIRMNASALSQDLDFQQNVYGKVKPSTWYTLSFNYFATQLFCTFLYDASNTTPWIDLTEGCYIDGADTPTAVTRIDGLHEWPAEWSGNRHSITFKTASTFSANTLFVLFRCLEGGQLAICMPKLEEGRVATAYMAHEDDLKGDNAPYNEHAYALSRSRTSHADDDLYQVNGVRWFPSAPDPQPTHPYVWERIMHYTSEGVNDQTSYICLTGAVGAMGKLCYMAGEYREDVEYTSNDSQTVAVEVSGTDDTTDIYYLNAESNVVNGTHIGPTDSGQTRWVKGMSQYNLVRARYLFADFAQFGAAVVSGDWLISVHGTINGTAYEGKYTKPDTYINGGEEKPTYFWFDPAYPNEDHAGKHASKFAIWDENHHNFIPHYAVNLLTGATYQNKAYIRGEVYATSGEFQNVKVSGGMRSPFSYITPNSSFNNDFSDNLAIYSVAANFDENKDVIPTSYQIPWDASQSGRKIIIANYKWGTDEQMSTGFAKLNAPDGKFFFEDGIKKSSIYMSREIIELVGYGDSSNFYGWIVLTRTDLGSNNSYGHNMKALAMGVVNVTGSTIDDISGYVKTFDKSEMTFVKDGVGKYTFRFGNTDWFNADEDVFVVVTGCGGTVGFDSPVYANLHRKDKNGFTVWTGDNETLNDGSFSFIVMNAGGWSSIIKNN